MSQLTNSPFGKRLRTVGNKDLDEDGDSSQEPPSPSRGRSRINPIFGVAPPALSLETHTSQGGSRNPSPASALSRGSPKRDYGDRFVSYTMDSVLPLILTGYVTRYLPSREDDIRTNFNLMEAGGPSTPSKSNRMIPSESDAIKGENIFRCLCCGGGMIMEEQRVDGPYTTYNYCMTSQHE